MASLHLTIVVSLRLHLLSSFFISPLKESLVLSLIEALVPIVAVQIWYHQLSKLFPQ